jgi:predicted amino acid racemase
MKMYINMDSIMKNAKILKSMLDNLNIDLVPVVKGVLSNEKVVSELTKEGFELFGESRIENIAGKDFNFMFLRNPSIPEIENVIKNTKFSLQSSITIMKHTQNLINKNKIDHKILIMVDMGDLRDGVYYKHKEIIDDILSTIDKKIIAGVATNLGCFGGVIPTKKVIDSFCEIANYINSKNENATIVSGGNTTTLELIKKNELNSSVNQFRVGEAILLGTDVTRDKKIEYLDQNTMFIEADLIEIYEKRLEDSGMEFGLNAFGERKNVSTAKPVKRGIVYMGEIDVMPQVLFPIDEGVKIIGWASDQIVLNLSESHNNYKVGDSIRFRMGYGSMLKAMLSPYVKKIFI